MLCKVVVTYGSLDETLMHLSDSFWAFDMLMLSVADQFASESI